MAFQSRPALDSEQIAAPAQANPSQLASLACAGREAEERLMEKIDNAERLLDSVVLSGGPEASLGIASPQLTVVIPAYNELATLSEIVERVCRLPISKQVIVVDDGSLDGTQQLIRDLADRLPIEPIFHSINQGKGAAIQTGFAAARGEIVIVQDADLEYEPEQIMQVIAPIQAGQAEVVYGSRYLASDNHHDSWIHRLGNRFLTGLSNLASGQKLTTWRLATKRFAENCYNRFISSNVGLVSNPKSLPSLLGEVSRSRKFRSDTSPARGMKGKRSVCGTYSMPFGALFATGSAEYQRSNSCLVFLP